MTTHIPTATSSPADERTRERRSAFTVWAILVGVTMAGWVLTDEAGAGAAIIAVIALFGLLKCWLIVQHFMEVRHAPRWLLVVTTVWTVGLWAAILLLFLGA